MDTWDKLEKGESVEVTVLKVRRHSSILSTIDVQTDDGTQINMIFTSLRIESGDRVTVTCGSNGWLYVKPAPAPNTPVSH